MESKILNFPEAMKLASVISSTLDLESIGNMSGEEFGCRLFGEAPMESVEEMISILLGNIRERPTHMITTAVQILVENKILDILQIYKGIGFTNG